MGETRRQQNDAELAEIRRLEHLKWVGESATQAWNSGRMFHTVTLHHGGTEAGSIGQGKAVQGHDVAGALQVIETAGWRLEATGYVFQPLKERSHVLTDSTQVTGNIVGIYTFRRPPDVPAMPS